MEILPVKAPDSDRYKIEARNLSYKLPPKYDEFKWVVKKLATNNKTSSTYILRNVNCEAKPGKLQQLLVKWSKQKTTLLDILAGNVGPSRVSGHVLVNDKPMKPANFRRISGYVTQDEALFPLLTVEETLMYSARFRLRAGDNKAKGGNSKLLNELGLDHVAGLKVGSESKSRTISGGEGVGGGCGVELVAIPHCCSARQNQLQPGFEFLEELFDKAVLLSNVALLYAIPVYWLVGLKCEFNAFAYYTLVSWMIFAMGNSFVAACSALVPNFLLGMSFIGCLIGAFFLFSGYFISKESIPMFWLFVHYLSLFKYPFECFLINEYGGEVGN
ncbi:hypothetical protein HAX54_020679 [Datura stramonium]|uniref:Uncharacterized protein n=1 Tax=Datura stramonium TaxID=4076 RepID=A0ABS8URI6_DATST|nr:hypothetical protein [Datura stramonium]